MQRLLATLVLAAAILLAGCVGGADLPGASREDAEGACDVTYPDGSPFDCATTQAVQPESASRPSFDSGWTCKLRWEEDGDPRAVFEIYLHDDGRAGLYWEARPWKNPGAAFVIANVLEPDGKGQTLIANWTAKGFAPFPEKPPAKGELHLMTRNLFADVRDADGNWAPAASNVIAGRYGGHEWFVVGVEAGGATRYLDPMIAKPKEGFVKVFAPDDRLIEGEGWGAYVTVETWGVKRPEYAFDPSPTGGRCSLSQLPGFTPLGSEGPEAASGRPFTVP
ncbi:MAG TPA: hypothetical protein VM889_12410 [Candidatus Thermoplasmatota archaeon]|nr:hypothetical protein [Candidatus Thermoplasmatota archaeon]